MKKHTCKTLGLFVYPYWSATAVFQFPSQTDTLMQVSQSHLFEEIIHIQRGH